MAHSANLTDVLMVPGCSDVSLVLHAAENQSFILAQQGTLEIVELMSAAERLIAAGHIDKAIALYKMWIDNSASPLAYVVYFNLGVALSAERDYSQAESMYLKALELNSNLIQARINLGNCLEQQSREDEALVQWRMVAESKNIDLPANKTFKLHALNNLGRLLETKKEYRSSLEMLEKSFALDTTQQDVLLHLVHLAQKMCIWPVYRPPKGITKEDMVKGTSPLAMLAASDDPALQLLAAKQFVGKKYVPAPNSQGVQSPAAGYNHEKIRIGYLSSDFCLHAVSILIVEMLELHDRERFEVYGFCWSRDDGTSVRKRVLNALNHYVPIGDMSDRDAAECIRSHEIDIMIDLQGLTSGARPLILSHHPATVQITYLGFPGTTALPWIDYVLADKYLIPEKFAAYFTERPLYMPNCFQVSDRKREVGSMPTRTENNLPESAFVFCSFNNNYKFTPELFSVWMRILKRVPDSVLWLLADNEWAHANLCKTAKKHGVKDTRLIFASRVPPADYLARYQLADLFLDTFPFNGGTTANDALFMGLPLLTLSGRSLASRYAGSLLTNLDLPELITTDLQEYENKAVQLALEPNKIKLLKAILNNKRSGVVFDTPTLTKDIEKLYIQSLEDARSNNAMVTRENMTATVSDMIKKVLNVGGNSKLIPIPNCFDGWQHDLLDIDPTGNPDILCDARKLSTLTPGQYNAIYCSHNLEHYYWHEVPDVLNGFYWLLKQDGFAFITVPDIKAVISFAYENKLDLDDKLYDSSIGPIHVLDVIYGYRKQIAESGVDFFAHKTGFSKKILLDVIAACGFSKIYYKCDHLEITALAFKTVPDQKMLAYVNTWQCYGAS